MPTTAKLNACFLGRMKDSRNAILCTHAAFGFAGLNRNTYEIRVLDPWNELETNYGKGAYNRFTKLKLINPNLKTLLSVGGWNEGDKNKNISISHIQHM